MTGYAFSRCSGYMASNMRRLISELYDFLSAIADTHTPIDFKAPDVLGDMFRKKPRQGRRYKGRARMTWGLYRDSMHF